MSFPHRLAAFALLWIAVVSSSLAAPQQNSKSIPDGGTALLAKDVVSQLRVSARPELAARSVVQVTGQAFHNALQVSVLQLPTQSWDVQAVAQINGDIHKGDVLLLSCWVRCLESTAEDGECRLRINVQQNRAPHEKMLALPVSASGQWQQVLQPFQATRELPRGNSNMTFHLGLLQQKLLIADVRLTNFGNRKQVSELPTTVESYRGRGLESAWRHEAQERIAQVRRAPLSVVVMDAAGRPVSGAAVTVKMLRHEFPFGSAVSARTLAGENENSEQYRQVVLANYNKIVFENDLKWQPWIVSKSNTNVGYRRVWTDKSFAWLQAHNIAVRGHYIAWAPLKARQLAKYRGKGELLRSDLWEHMQDKVPDVGDKVTDWDVINHIAGWGETIESVVGTRQIYADIVKRSRELAPDGVKLWINEGQVLPSGKRLEAYQEVAEYLIEHDAAPDGIGFMGHFGAHSLTPPARLYEIFDQFAKLSENLQITELDVNVGADESLQADYLRDVMTIAFSHPNMRSIMMWGFWEGRHWKPDAALYRRDWSLKPAGQVWRDLVFEQWWTNERGVTDSQGMYAADGFLGKYQVEVMFEGRAKKVLTTLSKPGQKLLIEL